MTIPKLKPNLKKMWDIRVSTIFIEPKNFWKLNRENKWKSNKKQVMKILPLPKMNWSKKIQFKII